MRILFGQLIILASGWINVFQASTESIGKQLFPEILGWKLFVTDRIVTPNDLWDFIDGAAGAYLSYDFVDLNLAEYQQDDMLIHVELYRHSSLENTFGIYASERNPDYHFIDIGTEGYTSEGVLNFLAGSFYVKIYSANTGEGTARAIRLIAGELVKALGQKHNWPDELQLLPETNKLERSEHYIASNFLGFDFLGPAFTAEYSDNGDFQIFIIHGRQQKDLRNMLRKYLAFTGQDIDPPSSETFRIKDPYNGDIIAMVVEDYLLGLVGCKDQATGIKYLEIVRENLSVHKKD